MSAFEDALNICIQQLKQGQWTLDECLKRYPQFRDELRVLLPVAIELDGLSAPSAVLSVEAKSRIREDLLARMRPKSLTATEMPEALFARPTIEPPKRRLPVFGNWLLHPRWATAAVAFIVVLSTGTLTAAASQSDASSPLFPVKRALERAQVSLTSTEEGRAKLHIEIAERRANEAIGLIKKDGRAAEKTLLLMEAELRKAETEAEDADLDIGRSIEVRAAELMSNRLDLEELLERLGEEDFPDQQELDEEEDRSGSNRGRDGDVEDEDRDTDEDDNKSGNGSGGDTGSGISGGSGSGQTVDPVGPKEGAGTSGDSGKTEDNKSGASGSDQSTRSGPGSGSQVEPAQPSRSGSSGSGSTSGKGNTTSTKPDVKGKLKKAPAKPGTIRKSKPATAGTTTTLAKKAGAGNGETEPGGDLSD